MKDAARTSRNALVATNAVWSLLRYAINWLALLVMPPLIIHDLGKDSYATWTIILQIATYYSMIDIHIQAAIARFVARSAAGGDRMELNSTVASLMLFLMVLAALVIGPGLYLTQSIDRIFPSIPHDLAGQASISASIILAGLSVSLPFTAMLGTFLGLERSGNVTIATMLAKIASIILMVGSVKLGGGIVALSLCFVAGLVVPILYYLARWSKLPGIERINLQNASVPTIKEFSSYSLSSMLLAVCSVLITGLSIPIITIYDFDGVANFALATIYANLLVIPQSAVLWVTLPRMSERGRVNDSRLMEGLLFKLVRLSSMSLSIITAGLIAISPLFLKLWVGPKVAGDVLPLALLLILGQFIGLTMHPYRVAIAGTGQQMRSIPAILLEGVANVSFSLLLVATYGAYGVAAASIVGAVVGVTFHIVLSFRLIDTVAVSRRRYLLHGLLYPVLAIAPAVLLLLLELHVPLPAIAPILVSAVASVFAGGLIWLLSFDEGDRRDVLAIAQAGSSRFKRG